MSPLKGSFGNAGRITTIEATTQAHHPERLVRNSATVFQAEGAEAGIQDFLIVNNLLVDLSTPLENDVSADNLIDAAGADASATPSASTLYYAYISNSAALPFPEELRLSATTPTNGYLGSGNAAEWRFVGAAYLDGSTQIANTWNICGFGKIITEEELSSNIIRSATSGDYDIFDWPNVITLGNTVLSVCGEVLNRYDVNYNIASKLLIGGVQKSQKEQYGVANTQSSQTHTYAEKLFSITNQRIRLQYNYNGSNTISIFGGANTGFTTLRMVRTTL